MILEHTAIFVVFENQLWTCISILHLCESLSVCKLESKELVLSYKQQSDDEHYLQEDWKQTNCSIESHVSVVNMK